MLVDEKGFPLGISSFEGNIAETKTPYEIEEYRREQDESLNDGQIFETIKRFTNKYTGEGKERRVIYQYKRKRVQIDLRNIDKQIIRAQKQIIKGANGKKAKFVKIVAKDIFLDEREIKKARLKAGIKGYVTNLDCDGQTVISGYHNLFNVEKSFRMAKSDLKARPIFHQNRDSIEVHLTVCFTVLGIERYIQEKTKMSIKKFVRKLSNFKTAIVEIAGKRTHSKPQDRYETQMLVKML